MHLYIWNKNCVAFSLSVCQLFQRQSGDKLLNVTKRSIVSLLMIKLKAISDSTKSIDVSDREVFTIKSARQMTNKFPYKFQT